jgi:hypothetical protein
MLFIENVGQFGEGARFRAYGALGEGAWLADDAIWITLLEPVGGDSMRPEMPPAPEMAAMASTARGVNVRLRFVGANSNPQIIPFDRLEARVSYFVGSDPASWRADVPVWGGVRYQDLYPGVDLEVSGRNGHWIWEAEADDEVALSQVRVQVDGVDALALESDRVRLTIAAGSFVLPLMSVRGAGAEAAGWQPSLDDSILSHPFTRSSPQSSPVPEDNPSDLIYSTFLGGHNYDPGSRVGDDYGSGIAVDTAGNAYVAGSTWSPDFPDTPGAFDTDLGGYQDAFVAKLNPSGSVLVYATFLGGSYYDGGADIAIDGAGNAYVTGFTRSASFPTTPGAFDTVFDALYDAFVTKLNAEGTALLYSTFLGGGSLGNGDFGHEIAVDGAGNAYVAGYTWCTDFPTTPGAFDTIMEGDYSGFVTKLNASGSGLVYSTFLGGSDAAISNGIALDGTGNAYVTGYTNSSDFPATPGAYDTSYSAPGDAFVTKVNADGSDLVYSTFLGGSGLSQAIDSGYDIAVDGAGHAWVTGVTNCDNFPTTPGALDPSHNGEPDAFVTIMSADGSELVYSTYLGGSGEDDGSAIAVDAQGIGFIHGRTESSDFPTTPDAFDVSYNGGPLGDAYVAKLDPAAPDLVYSTFLGGSSSERGKALAVDQNGMGFVTGETGSSDFPTTPGAFDPTYNGNDAFVARLALGSEPVFPYHRIYLPLVLRNREP